MADERLARLARYADFLANAPLNLIARGERQHVEQHIAEARALAPHLRLRAGTRWLDLGTGGGLPGIALAIDHPEVAWMLIDSVAKKVRAVEGFVASCGLENVQVRPGRAEELGRLPALRGAFDGVITRAVGPLDVVAEYARGFLRDGGVLAAVKGPRWEEEEAASRRAARLLRYTPPAAKEVPGTERPTWLVIMRALGPSPRAYPRRVGIPRIRPLGGRVDEDKPLDEA